MVVNAYAKSHISDWGLTRRDTPVTSATELATFLFHIPLSHSH